VGGLLGRPVSYRNSRPQRFRRGELWKKSVFARNKTDFERPAPMKVPWCEGVRWGALSRSPRRGGGQKEAGGQWRRWRGRGLAPGVRRFQLRGELWPSPGKRLWMLLLSGGHRLNSGGGFFTSHWGGTKKPFWTRSGGRGRFKSSKGENYSEHER